MKYNKKFLWFSFVKILIAALIMGGFVFWLRNEINFVLLALIGFVIYLVILFLFRGYTKKDVVNIVSSVIRR